jgi:S-adenosylmethionine:tRNA ribosyltransferase-isomerase
MHPLSQYNYILPQENIRKEPLFQRDHARLFVYDTTTDTVTFDYFYNLSHYLPSSSLMVINDTGVIPARVIFHKDTGGKVEGLVLMNEGVASDGTVPVIVNGRIFPGRRLSLSPHHWFTVVRQEEQRFYLRPEFDGALLPEILERYGVTPTPKYLGAQSLSENDLRVRYQTIFAKEKRSVAAPTASLHFTHEVFKTLDEKGVRRIEVTLDVGLGTFAEVRENQVKEKKLHSEKFFISSGAHKDIQEAKKGKCPIIAVGTTVTRTLEFNADRLLHESSQEVIGETDLFIMPPFEFKIVDHLLTNFHVPQSSLMALVDAFLAHKKAKRNILNLYEIAKQEGFMFYSFGDSMLIL